MIWELTSLHRLAGEPIADWMNRPQITNPIGQYETFQKDVSNGDYSFTAKHDGRFLYCFGNEHWGANSKEVSFNVHGIVYVSEADAPQDPLDVESTRTSPFQTLT